MKIKQEILDRIIKSKDETVTENIDSVYEYLSSQVPGCLVKKRNDRHSSYGLKHKLERILGHYVSNLDVKYCMELLGVKSWSNGINYYYPLSERWYVKIEKLADKKYRENVEMEMRARGEIVPVSFTKAELYRWSRYGKI